MAWEIKTIYSSDCLNILSITVSSPNAEKEKKLLRNSFWNIGTSLSKKVCTFPKSFPFV